jgi:SagB-type dehydrogenase family enzyme
LAKGRYIVSLPQSAAETVFAYHERSKHHLERYALGPGYLDWADQPNPFRRFTGCEKIPLPLPGSEFPVPFAELDHPENIPSQPLNLTSLGWMLELSFGLSAWKQYGADRWALRCNPSSGNLHPTEAYWINTDSALLPTGVYHYISHDHAMEKRCEFTLNPSGAACFIALTSIHWREAWKYGERAYRYCQHDIGHALGALRYAAAVLGWSLELMAESSDDELEHLLGLDRLEDFNELEAESPDLICRVRPTRHAAEAVTIADLLHDAEEAVWYGQADRLSKFHRNRWPVIDEIAQAVRKPHTSEPTYLPSRRPFTASTCLNTAAGLIRQRRSAQRFDALTYLPQSDFKRMMSAVGPAAQIPFDVWRWPPRVHLLLFVHRVENLEPGLYLLPRSPEAVLSLRKAISQEFEWRAAPLGEESPPLHRLVSADCRRLAKIVSCHQDIAGDSAFSMGMLAEFQHPVSEAPWRYRHLFWETGLIGQALYLEAEAAGVRGTGIGCFFDDGVHDLLGLQDNRFQCLYHFTVGSPLEDQRLQTLAAYAHL